MIAYYNEIDPFKAEVIREAIRAGAIAAGDVDERSIADVQPGDLVGYAQCHLFGGGGFWSLALRQAGWPDEREVWTGSCPCPSFSAAGKGQGFADPRHLWPHWARLICERHPPTIFGEQVAAAIGHGWLDLVSGDLEAESYAVAAAVLGAHSVGAPHIRQRLYFGACRTGGRGFAANAGIAAGIVADCDNRNAADSREPGSAGEAGLQPRSHLDRRGWSSGMGDASGKGLSNRQPEELRGARRRNQGRTTSEPSEAFGGVGLAGGIERGTGRFAETSDGDAAAIGCADWKGAGASSSAHRMEYAASRGTLSAEQPECERSGEQTSSNDGRPPVWPIPLNGWWANADWIGCRDGFGGGSYDGLLVNAQGRGCGERGDAARPGNGGHADGAEQPLRMDSSIRTRLEGYAGNGRDGNQPGRQRENEAGPTAETGSTGGLEKPHGLQPEQPAGEGARPGQEIGAGPHGELAGRGESSGLADTKRDGGRSDEQGRGSGRFAETSDGDAQAIGSADREDAGAPSPVSVKSPPLRPAATPLNGWWRDADWIYCRDGKWRPVESGTFPLAHGSPARVGRLRLYGDAICVPAARAFIESYLECEKQ